MSPINDQFPPVPVIEDSVDETKKKPLFFLIIGVLVIILIGLMILGIFVSRSMRANTETVKPSPTPKPQSEPPTITPLAVRMSPTPKQTLSVSPSPSGNDMKWTRTNDMSYYSFEYPTGWHVAFLWPDTQGNPIRVAIDDKPINTAPRGGSIDDLNVLEYSGIPNPEEKYQTLVNEFKSRLSNAQEQTLKTAVGNVLYLKGTMDIMGQTEQMEGYFFIIPSSSVNDKINYRVMTASISSTSTRAAILNHIIRSFQKVNP